MKGILLFVILGLSACDSPVKGRHGEIYRTPTEYNNFIINRQKRVGGYIASFYAQLYRNPDSARYMLSKGLSFANLSLSEITDMPAFRGDSLFRHSAINSFLFYKRLFEKDYVSILSLHKDGTDLTEADRQEEQRILNKIIKDEDQIDKELHNRQRDFAERNNMKLSRTE